MTNVLEIRTKFQNTLDVLIEDIKQDETIIAVLLFGSMVKGVVWEKSDIDLILITKDQKTPYRDLWLTENNITIQVSIMTRNQFMQHQQKSLQGSTSHHVLTSCKILYSNDETLNEFIENMGKIGYRDFQIRMLSLISMVIGDMEKAEKHLKFDNDLTQSYLFITRLLDNLAAITVMLNNAIPGREAVEQAMKFEPQLYNTIYTEVILSNFTKTKMEIILSTIRKYLEKITPMVFEPVINYLKKESTIRSVSDIAKFLNDKLNSSWWSIGAVGIGNWLVEQEYFEKTHSPIHLTLRSHQEMNEIGYYYIGDEKK